MSGETPVTIVGNLTDDVALKYTPQGQALAKFTVASTPRYFDKASGGFKDGTALFMRCTAWRELAENAAESLERGSRVVVVGRLRQESWEDKDTGQKRSALVLDVDEVGPSLRWATAKINKMDRASGGNAPQGGGDADPWSTAAPAAAPNPSGSDNPDDPPF